MEISLLDHLIITPDKYYSFADEGILWQKLNYHNPNHNERNLWFDVQKDISQNDQLILPFFYFSLLRIQSAPQLRTALLHFSPFLLILKLSLKPPIA